MKIVKDITESLSRISRGFDPDQHLDSVLRPKLKYLYERGFVMLDHLVGSETIKRVQADINRKFEQDLDIVYPCLAQSRIDAKRDKDLIENNFLATPDVLKQRQLTFGRDDIESYDQMIRDFQPSTLTIPMPSSKTYYDLWLDPVVMNLVSAYMGFVPQLTEAYIRRNFPCTYKVMNHYWHRDTNHADHLLKAFVFFTDCDISTGAHHYIAGSVHDERFRDKVYFTDDEINSVWPIGSENHMISTVPAGTIIIEDTRGLHKAGSPQRAYRDLGFAVFLPPNNFRKSKSYYSIEDKTFNSLSYNQKRFISSANVKGSH